MRESFALIINANSRKVRRRPQLIEELRTLFGDRGPFFVTNSPDELPTVLTAIQKQQKNTILICGGDGTLRQTLSTLISIYEEEPFPRIGILKGGTMNVVAGGLGIWRSPIRQLKHILKRADQKQPLHYKKRRLLRVNHDHGFIFAVGGFSNFVQAYRDHPDPTPLRGISLVLKTVFSAIKNGSLSRKLFPSFSVTLVLDEEEVEMNVTNISVASIVNNGFTSKPYYGASAENNTLGLLIFRTPPKHVLADLPTMFLGYPVQSPNIVQQPRTHLSFTLQKPLLPMLDGDILPLETTFDIQTGPLFRILTH